MHKMIVRSLIALFMSMLLVQHVIAQTEGSPYTVTASQAINARQCPRLDCGIVRSLAPETVVNVVGTVSGDTVLGSDQWVQIDDDGVQMYAHSSLVTPMAVTDQSADRNPEPGIELMDTARWLDFQTADFEFLLPRGWVNIKDLATDEEYLAGVEETYGSESKQWYLNLYAQVQDHTFDMVLLEFEGSGLLFVSHEEWQNTNLSARFLREMLETRVIVTWGGDVITSEIIDLPAGEVAVGIEAEYHHDNGEVSRDFMFGIYTDSEIYYLELVVFGDTDLDYYTELAHTIAHSFDHQDSDL